MKAHFVPRSYLHLFADPMRPDGYAPYLWVADFAHATVYKKSPENAAALTDYYVLGGDQGQRDDSAERLLSRFESAAIPVMKAVAAGHRQLSEDEWSSIISFLALQLTRVPGFREQVDNARHRTADVVMDMLANDRRLLESQLRRLHPGVQFSREHVDDLQRAMKLPLARSERASDESLLVALNVANTVASTLGQMRWSFLNCAEQRLVTSDRPVMMVNPSAKGRYGHGLLMRDIEVTFAVSPTVALLGVWSEFPNEFPMTTEMVDGLNEQAAVTAKSMCFCNSRKLAEAALTDRQRARA